MAAFTFTFNGGNRILFERTFKSTQNNELIYTV